MPDEVLYTKKRNAQYRGPSTSDDYNARIEENYRDLVVQANRLETLRNQFEYMKRYITKNLHYVSSGLSAASTQLGILDSEPNARFVDRNMWIDNDRFVGTEFEINEVDQLFYDPRYRYLTLPTIDSGSFSKLKFIAMDGTEVVSPNFKVFVEPFGDVEAQASSIIDANDFYNALISKSTLQGWEVNSLVASSYTGTSKIRVYVVIPDDQSIVRDSNVLVFDPLYVGTANLSNVKYSTNHNITFSTSDNWQDFNVGAYPINVGDKWRIPDTGDTIQNLGPTTFHFPPKPITAVSFEMSTDLFLVDGPMKVFSLGLNGFDIRYHKYIDEGKIFLRIEAGEDTISAVDDITPIIVNTKSSEVPFAFDYRVIWETAEDSGIYTLTPVPSSTKVWLEITLRKTVDGGAPALPYLITETS